MDEPTAEGSSRRNASATSMRSGSRRYAASIRIGTRVGPKARRPVNLASSPVPAGRSTRSTSRACHEEPSVGSTRSIRTSSSATDRSHAADGAAPGAPKRRSVMVRGEERNVPSPPSPSPRSTVPSGRRTSRRRTPCATTSAGAITPRSSARRLRPRVSEGTSPTGAPVGLDIATSRARSRSSSSWRSQISSVERTRTVGPPSELSARAT